MHTQIDKQKVDNESDFVDDLYGLWGKTPLKSLSSGLEGEQPSARGQPLIEFVVGMV